MFLTTDLNKVILKFRDGSSKEVKTKLNEIDKIISFLKITGDWDSGIKKIEIVENITSSSCNYQNMDSE